MRQLLYIILCMTLATSLQAQEARHLFLSMPDSILPTLTKVNRADCIDFLDSQMRALVKNRFDQQSEMTRLTNDYIAMQLSPKHLFEMKVFPMSDTTQVIICTVQTVCGEACDSRIDFYTTAWESLTIEKFITLPTQDDFQPDTVPTQIADTLSTSWESLQNEADILLTRASLADSCDILTIQYTTPEYMSKESAARFTPLLKRQEITYEWKDGRFVRRE